MNKRQLELLNTINNLREDKNASELLKVLMEKIQYKILFEDLSNEEALEAILESVEPSDSDPLLEEESYFDFKGHKFHRITPRMLSLSERKIAMDKVGDDVNAVFKMKGMQNFFQMKVIGESDDGYICLSATGLRPQLVIKTKEESENLQEAVSFMDASGTMRTTETKDFRKKEKEYKHQTGLPKYKVEKKHKYSLIETEEEENG